MDSSPPRVAVLLPVFNAASTLTACIRSLQRQTERRWHCALIDDGSTDDSLARAQALARDDRRIEVVAQAHAGLVATLNVGLEYCRAPYVARMDADDLMHRERLAAQLDLLDRNPQLSAVACRVRCFPRATLRDGWRAYETWLNGMSDAAQIRREAFIECPVVHPSLMLRRDSLSTLRYRDCGWPEDYDLVLRLLHSGRDIGIVPRRLLSWRDHPGRLTRRAAANSLAALTTCRAAFLASGFLATSDSYILWGYGSTGRALLAALSRHGKRAAYIVETHAGRIGNRIHDAPVVAWDRLPTLPHLPLIASVARVVPRNNIRAALQAQGWREGHDFVCAA